MDSDDAEFWAWWIAAVITTLVVVICLSQHLNCRPDKCLHPWSQLHDEWSPAATKFIDMVG